MTVFIWLWHLELYNYVFISLKKLRELVERGELAAHTYPGRSSRAVGVVGQCASTCFGGVALQGGLKGGDWIWLARYFQKFKT